MVTSINKGHLYHPNTWHDVFYQGISVMGYSERTRKAQEVHAEQLLKISTSLLTAFFVAILVVPISSVIAASFNTDVDINGIDFFFRLFASWYAVVFILAEFSLIYIVIRIRTKALDIYDELYPDSNIKKETHEQ